MNEPIIDYQNIVAIEDGNYTYEYDIEHDLFFISYSDEEDDYYICIYDGEWDLLECPIKDEELLNKYLELCKGE